MRGTRLHPPALPQAYRRACFARHLPGQLVSKDRLSPMLSMSTSTGGHAFIFWGGTAMPRRCGQA